MISRTEEFIRRNLAGQKTKQAKSRRNMLERLERVEAVQYDGRASDFRLEGVARAGDNVLAVSDLTVGYGRTAIAVNIALLLRRGERLGIIGPNGSGKTTFLKTIMGEIEALGGGLTWGANTNVAYFDQELTGLDFTSTVIEEIAAAAPRATPGELRAYLAKFLFTGEDVFKPVSGLSGGERSRLTLAKLIYSRANVLVLDEPTNHLDIPSREALERSLSDYPGTIITVSHDRYFLDRVATEILHFEDGSATYHTGSYTDYYEYRHRKQSEATAESAKQKAGARPEKSRVRPQPKQRRRPVEEIEGEIHALEQEMAGLAEKLANPSSSWGPEQYAEIGDRQHQISARLEQLYAEWESAAAQPG
jgi:ATP-binding cassette subfamily F protein 3